MLRSICALLCGFTWAIAASAATLAVESDKLTYNVGETITLTITGDDQGATVHGIFGRLLYSGALVNNGTRTQTQLVGPQGPWVTGALQAQDDGTNANSWAFNQVTLEAQTADNLPGLLSTVTLIAANVGIVSVNWDTSADGFELLFFGLTNAPGTSLTIVPEPATAALLGIGLLALAAARQRSNRR